MRSGRERDQHVKMQIAKLVGRESFVREKFAENLAGFQPVLFGRSQDGMIFLKRSKEFTLVRFRRSAPQFRKDNR